jgi:hypothetical protein
MEKLKKRTFGILFFLFANIIYSQTGSLEGKIFDGKINVGFPGVNLILKNIDNKSYGTQTNINGYYKFENLKVGVYSLKISYIGIREKVIENFIIEAGQKEYNLIFPEPCIETDGICPKNHSDNIIPIVYGLPNKRMIAKSKKGIVKLGGCDPSFCEKWYCKTHNISF